MSKPISCIIVDDEAIAREVISTHLKKLNTIEIVAECSNAIEALAVINKEKVDLIFLDIHMPEISGISFAKSINTDIKIIFTTAFRDYAIEGFELRAVDYLLKPISFDRLFKAVTTYFDVYNPAQLSTNHISENDTFLFVRSDRKMVKIDHDSIYYVESYSDYIKINTTNGLIVTRETISSIEAKLPKPQFIRIHRSYIVSVNYIDSFTNEYVSINSKSFTISRSYKAEVLKLLEGF
ncbi:LytR/AlgR family response regulator transcription factor [Winogradskyella sp. A3E31]|uniref:LytR/AlgR family response regulator transcription factor n=1 Tax=Winogradskyella sp. A3E31 TaxID=3349637 RepID=UPI00398A68C5